MALKCVYVAGELV